jgi:hypothetical protein
MTAASRGSNSHRQILQFFSNQPQFVGDLLGDLVFQVFTPLRGYYSLSGRLRHSPSKTAGVEPNSQGWVSTHRPINSVPEKWAIYRDSGLYTTP